MTITSNWDIWSDEAYPGHINRTLQKYHKIAYSRPMWIRQNSTVRPHGTAANIISIYQNNWLLYVIHDFIARQTEGTLAHFSILGIQKRSRRTPNIIELHNYTDNFVLTKVTLNCRTKEHRERPCRYHQLPHCSICEVY